MIVVSDTSPINYLVLIELQDLLPKLLDRVLIPDAVHRELQSTGAPEPIKRFLDEPPDWLFVQSSPDISPALQHLDAGEREAIALALAIGADLVLLDERKGRQDALDRLEKTNFRMSLRLFNHLGSGPLRD
ncbi:MAG: DUF3368 domain-containing protein [Acidimicrobiia bacterium]|nr:DUF3368 domain-containing protein [Acidimicrobiia bacterium]